MNLSERLIYYLRLPCILYPDFQRTLIFYLLTWQNDCQWANGKLWTEDETCDRDEDDTARVAEGCGEAVLFYSIGTDHGFWFCGWNVLSTIKERISLLRCDFFFPFYELSGRAASDARTKHDHEEKPCFPQRSDPRPRLTHDPFNKYPSHISPGQHRLSCVLFRYL